MLDRSSTPEEGSAAPAVSPQARNDRPSRQTAWSVAGSIGDDGTTGIEGIFWPLQTRDTGKSLHRCRKKLRKAGHNRNAADGWRSQPVGLINPLYPRKTV